MASTLSLRCSTCNARIKAPAELLGQSRRCPRCGQPFVVRVQPPQDAGPVLLPDEEAQASQPASRWRDWW